METLRLKDATRPQMARAARLHRREQRRRHGQTLVEGPQAVRELLACAPALARDFYATAAALDAHSDIRGLAVQAGVFTHVVAEREFADMSGAGQGLLAVIDVPARWDLRGLLERARLVVGCVELSDPGNLGTLVRVADAAGAEAVLLGPGSAEAMSPKAIRASAGSMFHVPVVEAVGLAEMAEAGHGAGLQVLAADAAGAWSLDGLVACEARREIFGERPDGPRLGERTLWILGNEARGFSGQDLSACDGVVSIPLYGAAESVNVAIAGAVLAYSSAIAQCLSARC